MKNKYIIRSGISEAKFREILKLFCMGTETVKVAKISKAGRVSVNKIFDKLGECIVFESEKAASFIEGEIEFDESYFGPK